MGVTQRGYLLLANLDVDGTPLAGGERMTEVRPGVWVHPDAIAMDEFLTRCLPFLTELGPRTPGGDAGGLLDWDAAMGVSSAVLLPAPPSLEPAGRSPAKLTRVNWHTSPGSTGPHGPATG